MRTFIITEEHLPLLDFESPYAGLSELTPQLREQYPYEFRLYDDDGELYYTGFAADTGEGILNAFDWGMYYAGSTDLRMQDSDGNWRSEIS